MYQKIVITLLIKNNTKNLLTSNNDITSETFRESQILIINILLFSVTV